ncbi:MAG: hypothetical protein HN576_14590 [Bacteriovoracaceae bacterium]|jgi:hypothetical protein|nr:hypothetical protein [Bacteriovoracaceae bacterium]
MNKWINKNHLIYSISFFLFGVSLVTTSKWTTPKTKVPMQFIKNLYELRISRFPFVLKVKDKRDQRLSLSTIKLKDANNHVLPLDYLIESNNRATRSYASTNGYNSESYSFIVSSHMRKDIRYKVIFKTKRNGIDFSLFPMNNITRKYSKDKTLNLTIKNNDLIKKELPQPTYIDKLVFFQSDMFALNKIETKNSHLKVIKNFNHLKLSSANDEMFFGMIFSRINIRNNDHKVSYRTKDLK